MLYAKDRHLVVRALLQILFSAIRLSNVQKATSVSALVSVILWMAPLQLTYAIADYQ